MNYSGLNVLWGLKIKQSRTSLKITQEKLAEIVDISQFYFGQIERGVRGGTVENLTRIANALNVSLDYLLSDYLTQNTNDLDVQWGNIIKGKTPQDNATYISLIKDLEKYLGRNN